MGMPLSNVYQTQPNPFITQPNPNPFLVAQVHNSFLFSLDTRILKDWSYQQPNPFLVPQQQQTNLYALPPAQASPFPSPYQGQPHSPFTPQSPLIQPQVII